MDNLPSILDGKTSSHTWTTPSDEVEANNATDCETIKPVRHVTPFLWVAVTCISCPHCNICY